MGNETREKDEGRIKEAILKKYRDATNFEFWGTDGMLADGTAYYVEFTANNLQPDESFYYAFLDADECRLFDDGFEMINSLQVLYERRRRLLQRIRDFDLPELVAAVIALIVTVAFVGAILHEGSATISKEFVAVFSLILGYYFGRNKAVR